MTDKPTPLMKYQSIDISDPSNVDAVIHNDVWELQQKLDGHRVRVTLHYGQFSAVASNGDTSKSTAAAPQVSHAESVMRDIFGSQISVTLDCEMLSKSWHAFDVVHYEHSGSILVSKRTSWERRSRVLEQLGCNGVPVVPTARTSEDKRTLWERIVEAGVEGAIAKHVHSTIEDGKRSEQVLKLKITHTIDVIVLERGPGNGRNGSGNWLKLGLHRKDGTVYEVGRCSTIGKPYAAPGDVIEVRYLYAGAGGRLVQPRHMRNRPDKETHECTTAQLRFVSKEVLS